MIPEEKQGIFQHTCVNNKNILLYVYKIHTTNAI